MLSLHRKLQLATPRILQSLRHAYVSDDVDVTLDAKPFEDIPGPKGRFSWPVIGTMFHYKPFTDITVETTHRLMNRMVDKYGSLVRILLGEWTLLVHDPADIEVIMKTEGRYPKRFALQLHLWFCEQFNAPKSIADIHGEDWHRLRSPLNPKMLRANSAQYYLPAQNNVADDLVAQIKLNGKLTPSETFDLLYRYACESISVVVYNKRLGYLAPDLHLHPDKLQALKDIENVLEMSFTSIRIPPFILWNFPLKIKKRYYAVCSRLYEHATEYYRNAMNKIEEDKATGNLNYEENNFMLSLLTSKNMTPEAMTSITFTLFMAGTDSTARNLQMIFYNLAKNPDKQEKLYEEISRVVGLREPLTQKSLNAMTYLQACLKESFRMIFPISSGTQRYLPTDIILQGFRIPAGTSVVILNQKTCKDPKYFPEPECFIPERWLRDEGGKRQRHIPPTALLPFGFGPRQCVGRRFAEQEIYLAVTKVLQHFRVTLEEDQEELDIFYTPFVNSRTPIKLIFEERK